MILKILLGLVVVLVVFIGYVSTREGKFRYERSGLINAPASEIYALLVSFKRGAEWSPYEKKDPSMKKTFTGADGQVGSAMEFDGSREVGSGRLELLKLVPNELVQIQLAMTKPFHAINLVEYKLTPESGGTRFSWAMSGDGGFMGKLMATLIDCEAMVAKEFVIGIENVRVIAEGKKS